MIGSHDSNSVTHVHFTMLHNVGQLMGAQTRPFRPEPPKSWVFAVPDLSRTRPELFKPVPNGSFPLIVVKGVRQVVRIEIMGADLLDGCDVDGDLWFMWIGTIVV